MLGSTHPEISNAALREFEEKAMLEGSELGEYWETLIRLNHYTYCMPEKFRRAFDKEYKRAVKRAKEKFKIIEKEETKTVTTKRLVMEGNK